MVLRIERDHSRFKKIVRGHIKKELRKYVSKGELIGRQGKELVSIPIPQIEIPQFRHGRRGSGGIGQGEGDKGQPVGVGEGGDAPGEHILEVDVSLDELAAILGEALALPRIEPRGRRNVDAARNKYTSIRPIGPESLRHFRKTYRAALKRQLIAGTYDAHEPRIIPIRDDRRYLSWRRVPEPESAAVLIYMMDVSGSMGDEQKEIVRIEAFWIDTWLSRQYRRLEKRYIVHDAAAHEVDRETFFRTRESGGTKISSAYSLASKLIDDEYPPSEWNIYPFHFTDGDNWGGGDTELCLDLLRAKLLPRVNAFCYGQVKSMYGSGQFIRDLRENLQAEENLLLSEIRSKDAIVDSIRDFLGAGK
jgi:uncharacterized sporulation protein YeaH/YhbH (DUF444 family)